MYGINFMINDRGVETPDDVDWTTISMGDAVDGLERRSHYRTLKWTKRALDCGLDWFQFDNTRLASIVCPSPTNNRDSIRYTDAYCKSVKALQRHGNMFNIQALFLVHVD